MYTYTWIIVEMRQNSFDKKPPTDPEAFYMWSLKEKDSQRLCECGFSYTNVVTLMQHFEVKNPSQLVGMSFESERNDAPSALDLFLAQIRNGGKYTPPTYRKVREMVAEALAEMKEPDLSKIDHETIARAFAEVWVGFNADKRWLKKFTKRIETLSQGKVAVNKCDPDLFNARVRGPAEYLCLVSGTRIKRLTLGPYSNPATFDID